MAMMMIGGEAQQLWDEDGDGGCGAEVVVAVPSNSGGGSSSSPVPVGDSSGTRLAPSVSGAAVI